MTCVTSPVCFVAQTRPNQETWAGKNIRNQGHDYYLPLVYDSLRRRSLALFPSYIFPITSGAWHFLTGTFGVSHVLMDGDAPAKLCMSEIEKLRAMENEHGHIQLPVIEFDENDPVRITAGIFGGRVGLYQGQSSTDRVRVLLDALGSVTIAKSALEAVR